MKTLLILCAVMLFVVLAVVVGCQQQPVPVPPTPTPSPTPTPTPSPPAPPPPEPPPAPKPAPAPAPNNPPNTPSRPSGSGLGEVGTSYIYSTSATDPDDEQVKYIFDWGDGTSSETGYVSSGADARESHSWSNPGAYNVTAKVVDSGGGSSGWSSSLEVTIGVKTFTLSASVIPYGSGNITPISGKYEAGIKASLTAEPLPGYKFSHWSGDISTTSRTITITMDSNKKVTAHFVEIPLETYTLTVKVIPSRCTAVIALKPKGGTIVRIIPKPVATHTFARGTEVTLEIVETNCGFIQWAGDVLSPSLIITIIMDSDKYIIANFK